MEPLIAYLSANNTGVTALLLYIFNLFTTSPVEWNSTLRLLINIPVALIGLKFVWAFGMGIKKNFFDDPKTNGGDYSFDKQDYINIFGNGAVAAIIFLPALATMFGPLFKAIIK